MNVYRVYDPFPSTRRLEDGLTTEEYNRGWTGFTLGSKRTEILSTNVNKIMSICPNCGEHKTQILPVTFPQYFPHGKVYMGAYVQVFGQEAARSLPLFPRCF